MPRAELRAEMASGVAFSGWERAGELVGVMGLQVVRDATLIRHAYVRPAFQGHGIGAAPLTARCGESRGRLLVGTWADAPTAAALAAQPRAQRPPDAAGVSPSEHGPAPGGPPAAPH